MLFKEALATLNTGKNLTAKDKAKLNREAKQKQQQPHQQQSQQQSQQQQQQQHQRDQLTSASGLHQSMLNSTSNNPTTLVATKRNTTSSKNK